MPSSPAGLAEGGEVVDGPHEDEGLQAAAEEILISLEQDFGTGESASESEKNKFQDKARRLADALKTFFDICESEEDEAEGSPEEEDDR